MDKTTSRGTPGVWLHPVPGATAFIRAQQKFGSVLASDQYPSEYRRDLKGYLEQRAAQRMISMFPRGGHILDCPSGTGREMRLLLNKGFRVTAADCSAYMVDRCRENMLTSYPQLRDNMTFCVEDISAMTFEDRSFDGVICNRLFHHYNDSDTRIEVLRELSRISRGFVIISFSNSFSISIIRRHLVRALSWRRRAPLNSVSKHQMAREFQAAGMDVVLSLPVLWGLSRMWYMAGRPRGIPG